MKKVFLYRFYSAYGRRKAILTARKLLTPHMIRFVGFLTAVCLPGAERHGIHCAESLIYMIQTASIRTHAAHILTHQCLQKRFSGLISLLCLIQSTQKR